MNDIFQPVLAVLERHPEVRLAIVFGSLARGEASTESDLDLAVAENLPLQAENKIGLIGELAAATGRPVDLVDLKALTGPLLGQILHGGKVLVKDDCLYAEAMLKAMYYEADEMPYRRRILRERQQAWMQR